MNVSRHESHDGADAQDHEDVRARSEAVTEDAHERGCVDRHEGIDGGGEQDEPDRGRAVEVAQLLRLTLVQEFGELRGNDDAQSRVDDHARLDESDGTTVDARGRITRQETDEEDVEPLQRLLEAGGEGARQSEGYDLTTPLGTRPTAHRVGRRGHVSQQQPPRSNEDDDEGQRPGDRHEGQRPGERGRERNEERAQAGQQQVLNEDILSHVAERPQSGRCDEGEGADRHEPQHRPRGGRNLRVPDQGSHGLENEDAHGGDPYGHGGHEGQGRADLLGSIQGQAWHQVDGGGVEAYLGQGHDDREDTGCLSDDTRALGTQHARQDDREHEAQDRGGGRSDEANDSPAREGTPGLICLTHD